MLGVEQVLRKIAAFRGRFKSAWNSAWTGIPLWLFFVGLWAHWHPYTNLPTPGKAIGVLAVIAGIMSVRDMKDVARAMWVLTLILFLLIEFRAIDKDHYASEQQQAKFFDTQRAGFEGVTSQAKDNFAETANGLKTAISGLKTTLSVATETLQQTQPHAALLPTSSSIVNEPNPPALFSAGTKYQTNFFYSNIGSEPGTILRLFGHLYVAKPDDLVAQKDLVKKFAEDWQRSPSSGHGNIVQPGAPGFWSAFQEFTKDDENKLRFERNTVYIIRRIEYKDKTGIWWSDRCEHFQVVDNTLNVTVSHSCYVLMNGRYEAKAR